MAKYFYEDTNRGLLLINYPMIESIKHYSTPILTNENYDIVIDNTCRYKEYIHQYSNVNITKYSKEDIESLIALNLIRTSKLLSLNKYSSFYNDELIQILNIQLSNLPQIVPIAQILFILPIYFGESFYDTLPHFD